MGESEAKDGIEREAPESPPYFNRSRSQFDRLPKGNKYPGAEQLMTGT
ncbi:hypothetical protein O9929_26215 [Vibrio lentus]|nr:hypothetical protein [Vibrio lentus]